MNQILACWFRFLQKQVVVVVPVKFACSEKFILLDKRLAVALPVWHMGRQNLFHALFLCEKCHDIRCGCSYSVKSRVRRQKTRSENDYLRK